MFTLDLFVYKLQNIFYTDPNIYMYTNVHTQIDFKHINMIDVMNFI